MAEKPQMLVINGHDYTAYIKQKTGFKWSRENTNDEKAGRDTAETMHTNVTSHQRKIEIKMGPIPWDMAQQLEADLQGGDSGVEVSYPDLKDGFCKRLFSTHLWMQRWNVSTRKRARFSLMTCLSASFRLRRI